MVSLVHWDLPEDCTKIIQLDNIFLTNRKGHFSEKQDIVYFHNDDFFFISLFLNFKLDLN